MKGNICMKTFKDYILMEEKTDSKNIMKDIINLCNSNLNTSLFDSKLIKKSNYDECNLKFHATSKDAYKDKDDNLSFLKDKYRINIFLSFNIYNDELIELKGLILKDDANSYNYKDELFKGKQTIKEFKNDLLKAIKRLNEDL